jgi:hypothetical protein
MRWPEMLFLLFVLVFVVALVVFGWGVFVLVLLAWLLGAALVAAVKYEIWRSRDFYVKGAWNNLELRPAEDGEGALLNLRLKHYVQVGLTAEQARQLRDRIDSALKLTDGESKREPLHP